MPSVRLGGVKRLVLRVAFAAALVVSAGPALATPSCSLADIAQAAKETYNTAPASCAAQSANPYFYALTAFLIGFTQTPQGKSFCSGVEDIKDTASDVQKQAASYWDKVPADQQNTLQSYVPALADASASAADVSGALDTVSCACQVAQWEGPGALYGEISSCVASALCDAQDWMHDNISSSFAPCEDAKPPPPPQLIDCRPDPRTKDASGPFYHLEQSVQSVGEYDQCFGHYLDGSYVTGYRCEGSFCFSNTIARSNTGNYCYCPPAMQHAEYFMDSPPGNCYNYLNCRCPEGSQPLSDSGAGAYICMCPNGMPVGDDGVCQKPPPKCDFTCPATQVVLSKDTQSCTFSCGCPDGDLLIDGTCTPPCADPTQVMLASGACCKPSQAAACGECCPIGMQPDPVSGNCVPLSLKPATPTGPLKPQNINSKIKSTTTPKPKPAP